MAVGGHIAVPERTMELLGFLVEAAEKGVRIITRLAWLLEYFKIHLPEHTGLSPVQCNL